MTPLPIHSAQMDSQVVAKPRLSPKDFVLYAGAMISLYVSIFALLALLFQYVDYSFRDALDYIDPYNSGLRFAMATLLVFFPLLVWLTRVLNQDMRRSPEKRDLGFRKWLLYITLLVAGLGMAIDLVVLLNTFLGGEITARFILKALSVFLVASAVFMHYLADLRGYWERNESKSKMVGAGASLLVVATIASGFFIMGSPMSQRDLRFDQERISDLQTLQWQIVNYWQAKQKLPASIDDLDNSLTGFVTPVDPESGESYTYTLVPGNALSFKLCATFTTESDASMAQRDMYYAPITEGVKGDNWEHGVGEACFDRTIDPDFFPPLKGSVPEVY